MIWLQTINAVGDQRTEFQDEGDQNVLEQTYGPERNSSPRGQSERNRPAFGVLETESQKPHWPAPQRRLKKIL